MSWLKALTSEADKENSDALIGTTDAPPAPNLFEGSLSAAGSGVPRGLIEARGAFQTVVNASTGFMMSVEDQIAIEDAAAENFQSAADFTPDPNTTGAAAKVLHEVTRVVPRTAVGAAVAGPVGAGVTAGVPAGIVAAEDLKAQGIDDATANKVGVVSGITMGVGAMLPGSNMVKGVLPDLGAVVGANVGLGVVDRAANHQLLSSAGYEAQAEQYKTFDSQAMVIDGVLGAAFKGVDMAVGNKPAKSEVAAALVVNQQHHAQTETAPGLPADPLSARAHTDTLESAINATLRGEPVNVAKSIAGTTFIVKPKQPFTLDVSRYDQPQSAVPAARDSVVGMIVGLESGGKDNAKNPLSSATGAGQFTNSTWLAMVNKHRPDLAQGKTKQQILELRKDGELSREMVGNLVDDNAQQLRTAGIANPSAMDLYLAHHFGANRVPKMRANPGELMDTIINANELKANPAYKGKTVAQVVASFERRAGVKHSTPVERTQFANPEQLMQNEFVGNAKKLGVPDAVARQIAPKSPMDDVTGFFDARQGGVKTTTIERAQQHVTNTGEPAQYVSADVFNLGGLNQAVGNRAEAANVHYRAMAEIVAKELEAVGGDVVPLRTGGDEFGAIVINVEAAKVQTAIRNAETRVAEYGVKHGLSEIPHSKRSNEKGVGLHFGVADIHPGVSVRDILDRADSGVNASKLGIKYVPRETIGTARAQSPSGQTGRTESGNAAPDGSVRPEGRAGSQAKPGQKDGQVSPGDDATLAAEDVLAQLPDIQIANEDGSTVSAREALTQAQADIDKAQKESVGFTAAISCFLRTIA